MSSGANPPNSSSSSSGTNVFGSLPKAGFLRRGSNKLALKTPTPSLHQAESEQAGPLANGSYRFESSKHPTLTLTNENEDSLYGINP
ncbi:BZ3500_MvSof-1268-A1-R1_Chr1-3g02224 [Microbotryum saponariae]|uniref:BZ3500_MvSof-1268-A1-R1_Chr1-3g02224 protein n=1 Tax=Microbotryum saponariae TaxID=289078 RepID=A0A2X0KV54_9BASI|nr:BZ3500_MvSof-1268-A1-R1_Chr1-3g02224 [Microbotryum saponariae]SCZ95696.1 BZ3501_MvSof-1269-A2-R1_Chr1-3g01827 [Microbotryum saponariae]